MTDFENNIKRNVTKELFFNIMNEKYGDSKNTGNYRYGDVSSWFSWARDDNGKFILYRKFDKYFIDFDEEYINKYDKSKEKCKQIFWEKQSYFDKYLKRLTTDIIFVGLNISNTGEPPEEWPPFTNARHNKNIIKLFIDTEAEGGYFTDIIKPDERIKKEIERMKKEAEKNSNKRKNNFSNGAAVLEIVKNDTQIQEDHFNIFKNEIDFIKAEKPLLVVFGSEAKEVMEIGLNSGNLTSGCFKQIIYIYHYQQQAGGFDKFLNNAVPRLNEYFTIPCDKETLEEKWKRHGLSNKISIIHKPTDDDFI